MPRCPTCFRRVAGGAPCPQHPEIAISARPDVVVEPPEVPGYRIGARLGSGGFATVWAAVREADAAEVAIKISHSATAKVQRRFAGEAEALARVGPPHVPELYQPGLLHDGRPYLVMEQLAEPPLAQVLGQLAGPPPLDWVHRVADAVLACLEVVHAADLVHGDLKPDNIALGLEPTVRARLIDFGTARQLQARSVDVYGDTETREEVVGSAEYMAPEMGDGHAERHADIYAMGVLLYELITLRVPFVGDVASIRHGHRALRPQPPSAFAPVPEALEAVCLGCLAKEPERRPGDAAALRRQLVHAVVSSQDAIPTVIEPEPSRPRSSLAQVDVAHPVVLLAVDMPALDRTAELVIQRNKGVVVQQHGLMLVCGFSALDDEEPVQEALACARELVERHGARAVAHLAPLTVRRRRRGQPARFYGPALERTESWIPATPWRGVLLTPRLASLLPPERTRPAPDVPELFAPVLDVASEPEAGPDAAAAEPDVPLVGRDDVLARAAASLRAMLEDQNPALFTLSGDSGLGKTRLARELGALVARVCPEALVLSVRAVRRAVGRPDAMLPALLELLAAHTGIEPPAAGELDPIVAARLLGDGLRAVASARPVALIVDDVHHAEGAFLDALEYATLDGRGIALWVAAVAHPHLRRRRPRWGLRAHCHVAVELEPLGEEPSMKLAAELLRPAEYPPAATLRRLARWAGGSPHSLGELVRTLKREGIVRKRVYSDSWYVATPELDRLPASPAEQWLAARQLDALPAELAACLRVCAVLGVELLRDELAWVLHAADRSGTATSSVDPDVGLRELERLGFIEVSDGVWAFGQAAFQDAVYRLVGSRERKHIHHDALGFWRGQAAARATDRVLAAMARHAGGSEARAEAADAYLALADRERLRHRDVDADEHYSAALGYIDEDDHGRRARALGGRGRVRYRVQRTREALEDLRAAQRHARAQGASGLEAELLLDEATVLDWEWCFVESAERVEQARPLVEAAGDMRLTARLLSAVGRACHRRDAMSEAIDALERAAALAHACGDDETRIVALLVLASAFTYVHQLDQAAARFDEVIAMCERTGDRLHLCAAYSNTGLLWIEENAPHKGIQHLRTAIKLAREVGQPILERTAAHNLAELLYRSGKYSDALSLAERGYALQRFLPEPVPPDALLLGRVHAALDHGDEVRAMVARVRELAERRPLTQLERIALCMLERVADELAGIGDASAWEALLTEARQHLPGDELLELLYFRARAAARAGRDREMSAVLAEAQVLLEHHPVWRRLFDKLAC